MSTLKITKVNFEDELRNKLGISGKSKKTYVTCHVDPLGYIACLILNQNGFDYYNLNDGYRLYTISSELIQHLTIQSGLILKLQARRLVHKNLTLQIATN